jgi:hypothetical protein
MTVPKSFLSRWQCSLWARVVSGVTCFLMLNAMAVVAAPVPADKPAGYPAWWFARGVIRQTDPTKTSPPWALSDFPAPDDYAVANLGQLKQMATQAAAEMNASLPQGGAGAPVNALIAQWTAAAADGVVRDDYTAINLGQLKAVAQLFYDRLIAVHYTSAYPWATSGLNADDYNVANVGQLKSLFSFDVAYSTLNDGLPDWWVLYYNLGSVTDPTLAAADPLGNGITNLMAFTNGTDPTNWYAGQTVVLTLVSGASQSGAPGAFLPQPIAVSVMKADGITPWTGAPVTFTADAGLGSYSTAGDGSAPLQTSLTAQTDTNGQVTVYFQPAASISGSGYATASTHQLPFVESGYDPTSAPTVPPTLQVTSSIPGQATLTWSTKATNGTFTIVQM